jgi:glycosyltransferase involved in cell wall biosynthesis
MNVLYISYDGMTDSLGQSQVIPYLIGLSKKGHSISIISCEKKDRFEKLGDHIKKSLDSNNISWTPLPYSQLPSIFSKQLNLARIQGKAKKICIEKKIELVHCRSYMAALIGLKLKKQFGVKFLFDMRGFWADERIDGNIWDQKNPIQKRLYRYFKKKELEFLKHADYTISLTENAKMEILSWKPFQRNVLPIEIIPCCADLNLFSQKNIDSSKKEELRSELQIKKGDFIISYLGSIGTWYMLDEMLDFFKCLLANKTNAKFLFITPDNENTILSKAESKGISKEKIIILSANRNEVPLYLSLSAVSIYFIKPLYSKKASSPTKTGEIMALGIPIITNTGIGDSDKIINDSGSGMLISEFNDIEYNRIISQIDVLLNIDKKKITDASMKYFALEKGVELYPHVYIKLSEKKYPN